MDDQKTPAAQGYAAAVAKIRSDVDELGTMLAIWGTRDDDKPSPAARSAANVTVDAIDSALAGLHALRRRLVSEIRRSDDATGKRVDEPSHQPARHLQTVSTGTAEGLTMPLLKKDSRRPRWQR